MNSRFKYCLAILLVTQSLSVAPARESREAKDLKELARLEMAWNEAQLHGNADALDRLCDDDLIVTVPDMPLMDKSETLAFMRSGRLRYQRYQTSDLRMRVYKNSAVVTGQLERVTQPASKTFEDDWRFTKVYVRRDGRWLIVAWHGSHVGSSN